MGRNLTPEVIRLLLFAGCHVVRHGKGDHDILDMSNQRASILG